MAGSRSIRKILYLSFVIILLFQRDIFAQEKLWQGEFSLGYSKSSGNTQSGQLSTALSANRKTDSDEFTIKGSSFYSSSERKMNAQKWSGMVRYAFSFWEKKWYNFYKLESDHDRFANIDYRIIPSIGIGYWFSDEPDWKLMMELATGLEHTDFKDDTEDSDEAIAVTRLFLEKKLFGNSKIKQDLYVYPSIEDPSEFRIHSETTFDNPIDDKLSLRLSLLDDYDSEPAKNAKKNDLTFTSSLVYSF